MKSKSPIKILNVEIDNLSSKNILEEVERRLSANSKQQTANSKIFHITTVNPEFIMLAQKDSKFRDILNQAQLRVPDGVGIIWAGKILGKKFAERTTGLYLLKELVRIASEKGLTIGLIGGGDKIALTTGECLEKLYPKLKWWGEQGPEIRSLKSEVRVQNKKSKISKKESELPITNYEFLDPKTNRPYDFIQLVKKINKTRTSILFCAFGAPKQEYFIDHLIHHYSLSIHHSVAAVGVGGAFDEIAGKIAPAPLWLDKIGIKWFWRLIQEPWRWKRQVSLIKFAYLVLKSK